MAGNHLSEVTIEALIREGDGLGDQVRLAATSHLAGCTACRAIADYLQEFHSEFRRVPEAETATVDAFLRVRGPSATIIALHPLRLTPVAPSDTAGYSVLAAATATMLSHRYRTVATFGSSCRKWLLRVLFDYEESRYLVYVLNETGEPTAGLKVSLAPIAADLVTGKNGCAEYGVNNPVPETSWSEIRAVIQLPFLRNSH